ncbi:MAG TPA: hypothetical protein VMY43_12655 [Methanothrix sp.]|nr:hypothetical protein [Methanothrix sp.]
MTKRFKVDSNLIEIAMRSRGSCGNDGILKIPSCLIDVREHIDELYKEIAEQTIFEHDDEFVPRATGLGNPDQVAELQEKIASLKTIAASLESIFASIERKFKSAKVEIMSLDRLDNFFSEVQARPAPNPQRPNRLEPITEVVGLTRAQELDLKPSARRQRTGISHSVPFTGTRHNLDVWPALAFGTSLICAASWA